MTEPNRPPADSPLPPAAEDDEPSPGPSLPLLYTLIALALIAAIGCAMLIVRPFYHRIH